MRIETCWFCSSPVYPGHGMTFARNDGKVFKFCRPKCHKNFKRKRNPRKVKWTKSFRKTNGKEMAVDTTFEFEKRRNRPVKYDRNVVGSSLRAMKRVAEIKSAREEAFYKARMAPHKAMEREKVRLEIAENVDLVAPAMSKDRAQINVLLADMESAAAAAAPHKAEIKERSMTAKSTPARGGGAKAKAKAAAIAADAEGGGARRSTRVRKTSMDMED